MALGSVLSSALCADTFMFRFMTLASTILYMLPNRDVGVRGVFCEDRASQRSSAAYCSFSVSVFVTSLTSFLAPFSTLLFFRLVTPNLIMFVLSLSVRRSVPGTEELFFGLFCLTMLPGSVMVLSLLVLAAGDADDRCSTCTALSVTGVSVSRLMASSATADLGPVVEVWLNGGRATLTFSEPSLVISYDSWPDMVASYIWPALLRKGTRGFSLGEGGS